jgi:hypothetical protein
MRYPAGLATILVLATGTFCALSPPAWAESAPSPTPSTTATESPTPAVAATPDPISMEVRTPHLWDLARTSHTAIGHVLLTNPSEALATSIDVSGHSSDGKASIDWGTDPDSPIGPVGVGANGAGYQPLSFTWDETQAATGWIVFSPASGPSAAVPFEVKETISSWALLEVLGAAALLACGVMLLVWLGVRLEDDWSNLKLADTIPAGPTWKFTDSWATNLTSLGAILATVLGASGFLSEILPGRSVGAFVGLNVLYGFLVAAATLVYQAMYRKGMPTYRGLLVAGGMVMAAVIGEVATALILVARGEAALCIALAILVAVLFVLIGYARTSIKLALTPDTKGAESRTTAALL